LEFFVDLTLPAAIRPASNQPLTEMSSREYSWRVKKAGAWAQHVATFMRRMFRNSGSFNLLEPSLPVQACIRIDCTILTHVFGRKLRASEDIRIWNSKDHFSLRFKLVMYIICYLIQ